MKKLLYNWNDLHIVNMFSRFTIVTIRNMLTLFRLCNLFEAGEAFEN